MVRIRNIGGRVQTVELASPEHGHYTGRRGQRLVRSFDLLPGGVSMELPDGVAELPVVLRKCRAGLLRVERVARPVARAVQAPPTKEAKPKAPKRSKAKAKVAVPVTVESNETTE